MYIDSRLLEDGTNIEVDLCVVGGGAAGITIAREFTGNSSLKVCVLESGGFEYDKDLHDLYRGENVGDALPWNSNYLMATRLRYFGGTTNHWAGWCVPLDEVDFEVRPWVEHSGWPFSKSELLPYYQRALKILGIHDFDYDVAKKATRERPQILRGSSRIETHILHRSAPTRFGQAYREDFRNASTVDVYLHANLVDIRCAPNGQSVTSLKIKCLNGTSFEVRAKKFVLATGGIENARLLLSSNSVCSAGIGNENDLVGRFFMEHLEMQSIGQLILSSPNTSMDFYQRFVDPFFRHVVYGVLCVPDETQREENLLNCSLYFSEPMHPHPGLNRHERKDWGLIESLKHIVSEFDLPDPQFNDRRDSCYFGVFKCRSEQSPNPLSRVTLIDEKDPLGLPRVRLDWRLREQDRKSVERTVEILAEELGKLGEGRVRLTMKRQEKWQRIYGGAHHIGTTRMHNNPKHGVVDRDCKIHSMSNLYIAGSSVFPTAGFANPTYTIVALALRLADHLKTVILP